MSVAEQGARTLVDQGKALMARRLFAEALALFERILEQAPDGADAEARTLAFVHALRCASRTGRWPETERIALQAIEEGCKPAQAYEHLGEALAQQDRRAEAEAALGRALELEPKLEGARSLLSLLRREPLAPSAPRRPRPWPGRQDKFKHPASLIQRYMLDGPAPERFITPRSRFLTFGSCFAEHLARRLAKAGYEARFEAIGEAVNSTYANRYLLQWIEQGPVDGPTALMEEVYGPQMRERFVEATASSDVFVMTLGLAPCFFDEATGEFAFASVEVKTNADALFERRLMRTTTVAENLENLRWIIAALRRMARRPPKIVLTVSPVPLNATTELDSAIVADCLSKSVLRVACHEAIAAEGADVVYWPSFEIVRWLDPHWSRELPPAYAADDDNSRHVSRWLIDVIIEQFLAHYAEAPAVG
jgi:tetratricopeptide (TPR) repeat protein